MKNIKLFCFPWAGGTATLYYKWKKLLDESIELLPIELSGRGSRYNSPPYNTFSEAVEDTFESIKDDLNGSPYAFFGHSMGTLIAYELCHKIKDMGIKEPAHIFMSGRWAPSIIKKDQINYDLPDEELKKVMLSMGGTSQVLIENNKLLDTFIPVFRSDMRITETYKYVERNASLSSSITAMTGISDTSICNNDLLEWQKHTKGELDICKFKGGHFFINDSMGAVVKNINKKITNISHIL